MIFHFDMTREASRWVTWRSSWDACERLYMSAVWFCNDVQVSVVRGVPIQSQSGASPCFCKHEIVNFFYWESISPPGEPQRFLLICFQRKRAILPNQSARTPLPMFTKYLFTWWILAPETKAADTIINHRNFVSSWRRLFIYQHTHTPLTVWLSVRRRVHLNLLWYVRQKLTSVLCSRLWARHSTSEALGYGKRGL